MTNLTVGTSGAAAPDARYTVISSDCHAGADLGDYRAYLDAEFRDEFDGWAATYVNPFSDLQEPDADRNWDSDRRNADMDADGVAGEVIFPNTVPPFFPSGALAAEPPESRRDVELRNAGLRAHNRWLADFCARSPERRAGVGQIAIEDVDEAVREVEHIAALGLRGGVLLPGVSPSREIPQLYSEVYEPLWVACEEHGIVLNHHAGSASPRPDDDPAGWAVWVYETHWFAHRVLWHLLFSGVLDRHPGLRLVLTEQGTGWLAAALESLEVAIERFGRTDTAIHRFAGPAGSLTRHPREVWATQCYSGASFLRPNECAKRHAIGVDRIMWGSDYPHYEGTAPFSREALRHTFAGVDVGEVAQMICTTAAEVYRFDLDALAPLAARIGPTVAEVDTPLAEKPAGSVSSVFEAEPIKAW